MQANDRERFNDLIRTLCKPYRLELDATDFDIWWVVLNEFPFEVIEASVVQYLKTGKYAPKPADLYTAILDRYRSLWWSPDEAWVHALRAADEDETVVWTNEAATAFGEARIALERGDEFGARAAFIKAYQRLVEAAIEDRRVPEYTVSLGFDRQRRINAIQQAKAQGYLPADRANRLLAENSQGMKERRKRRRWRPKTLCASNGARRCRTASARSLPRPRAWRRRWGHRIPRLLRLGTLSNAPVPRRWPAPRGPGVPGDRAALGILPGPVRQRCLEPLGPAAPASGTGHRCSRIVL